MHMFVIKNITNNIIYAIQESDVLLLFDEIYLKFHYKAFHFHQYFHCSRQLIYQLSFFYNYNFHNLDILQYRMIYHIHTHNY